MRINYQNLLLLTAVIILAAILIQIFFLGGWEQIQEVQKSRTEAARNCARAGGERIDLYKSSRDFICVGPDGKIIK